MTTPIDVLRAMGFEEWSTGGGCTALGFTRPDGEQCMVTNDAVIPEPGEDWDVGFYREPTDEEPHALGGGDCYRLDSFIGSEGLLEALAVIAAWRIG